MPRKIITLSDSALVGVCPIDLDQGSSLWSEESVSYIYSRRVQYPGLAIMAVDCLVQQEVTGVDGDYSLSALYVTPTLLIRSNNGPDMRSLGFCLFAKPTGSIKFVLDRAGRRFRRVSHASVPHSVVTA